MPSFDLWDDAPASKAALIVIDECSMVDAELGRDLMSFGVPLLVLGDPAQLPPIQGGGFFTDAEPDAMLTEVHRQAEDNPIIRLSMDIRAGRELEPGRLWRNRGRHARRPRSAARDRRRPGAGRPQRHAARLQRADAPAARLRRRHARDRRQARVPAQQQAQGPVQRRAVVGEGKALDPRATSSRCGLQPDDGFAGKGIKVSVRPECFTGGIEELEWPMRKRYDEFDYGYVLTVHKAQGSQWDDVVLFDEFAGVRREPPALALHRRHARGEAIDSGGVNGPSLCLRTAIQESIMANQTAASRTIEDRIRAIEDRLEIFNLIASHPPSADTGADYFTRAASIPRTA